MFYGLSCLPFVYFRPEDNDDVVEIIDKSRPAMRESLGDFYIAEEVLSDQPDESIIIAEVCMSFHRSP